MRTSSDVIKRLQWDENLPQEFFTIGYVDRFLGIVEDPFTKFSHWGDLVITVIILKATFLSEDPKSAKKTDCLAVFFALLGSAHAKAA